MDCLEVGVERGGVGRLEVFELCAEHAPRRVFDRPAEFAVAFHQGDVPRPKILVQLRRRGREDDVVSRADCRRECRGDASRVHRRAVHHHVVSDYQPVVLQVAAKNFREEFVRERCRLAVSDYVREAQVPAHYRGDFLVDEVFERNQLAFFERLVVRAYLGKLAVRVERRVAVTGKMLRRRNDARIERAAHEFRAEFSHEVGVLPERARADDRRIYVRVQIDGGREIHVYAERVYLARYVVRRIIRVHRKRRRPDCHVSRRLRRVALDVPNPAAFLVGRDEKGNLELPLLRAFLDFRYRLGDFVRVVRVPAEHLHASKSPLGNPSVQEVARLFSRPAEHQNLRQKLPVVHLRDEEVGKLRVGVIAPEIGVVRDFGEKGRHECERCERGA